MIVILNDCIDACYIAKLDGVADFIPSDVFCSTLVSGAKEKKGDQEKELTNHEVAFLLRV